MVLTRKRRGQADKEVGWDWSGRLVCERLRSAAQLLPPAHHLLPASLCVPPALRLCPQVRHNPSTLEKVEPGSSDEKSPELQKAARWGLGTTCLEPGAVPRTWLGSELYQPLCPLPMCPNASAKRRGVQKRAQRSGAAPQEQEEQEAGGRSPRSRRSGTAAAQAPTRPKAGGSRTRARGKAAAPKTPAGRSSGRKRKAAEPAPASGRATRASKAGMTTRAAAAKRKKRG